MKRPKPLPLESRSYLTLPPEHEPDEDDAPGFCALCDALGIDHESDQTFLQGEDGVEIIVTPIEEMSDAALKTLAAFGLSPEPAADDTRGRTRIGRNERCFCGSGRKYKRCHLIIDTLIQR